MGSKYPLGLFPGCAVVWTLTFNADLGSVPGLGTKSWQAAQWGQKQNKTKQNALSVRFSHSDVSDFLWPHGQQHTRLPCPSPTPGACSNSCPLSRWCHPTISILCRLLLPLPSIFPSIRVFPKSQLFASGGQILFKQGLIWPHYWGNTFLRTLLLILKCALNQENFQSHKTIDWWYSLFLYQNFVKFNIIMH